SRPRLREDRNSSTIFRALRQTSIFADVCGRFLVQAEGLMQGTHGQFHVLVVDDHRSLDLAGADHLDVDALFRQRTEHAAGHANVTAHADTDDGYLADLVVRHDFLGADGRAHLVLQQIQRASEIVAVDREREVRGAFDRLVLQNHVHVDVGRCHGAQDGVRDTGLVRYGKQGELRFVATEGDARDYGMFHFLVFL